MIRLAKNEDLESVVEIYNHAVDAKFQTAFTERFKVEDRVAWFQQYLGTAYPMFVYTEDQKVVGWLSLGAYREGRAALRHSVEVSYYIHSSYQRKGIGSSLLEYALTACRELNYKVALAIIIDKNVGSIRLMEKFGFEQWGYLPGVADYDGVECGQVYYGLRLK